MMMLIPNAVLIIKEQNYNNANRKYSTDYERIQN